MKKTKQSGRSGLSRRGFIGGSLTALAGIPLIGGNKSTAASSGNSQAGSEIKEYRQLGKTGFKVSDIGFGTGALTNPAVLNAALDMGINYLDTAEHYTRGQSERTIGEVIKKRDRKKLFITTKLNFRMGESSKAGLKQRFMKCLERMQTDYADCLMIHMTPTVDQITSSDYHEAIEELKKEGKVLYSGLSNHGPEHNMAGRTRDTMEKVMISAAEDGRFDVSLFVYNFLQKDQGEAILKSMKKADMGATLMKTNPVKTYQDIENSLKRYRDAGRAVPEAIAKMAQDYKLRADRGESFKKKYGLKSEQEVSNAATTFTLNNPMVHSVCPTINNFESLETYVGLSGTRLSEKQSDLLAEYRELQGIFYCRHACGECETSCPYGVPVNTILRYHHYFSSQGREKHAMEKYASGGKKAAVCESCSGHCNRQCPHGSPVQGLLINAHYCLTI